MSTTSPTILVVEDEDSFVEALTVGLKREGFRVQVARDGAEALDVFDAVKPDLVLLDVMLPKVSGIDVCRELRRRSSVPIIMVTAKGGEIDTVVGLEVGADDYVTKPFESAVLLARVRAILRRIAPDPAESAVLQQGDLRVDTSAFTAWKGDLELELSATEFRLLTEMVRHPGQVLTREVLLRRVWNYDYLGDSRLVDMAVKRLRDKIEEDPASPVLITTVRGVGYRFERSP